MNGSEVREFAAVEVEKSRPRTGFWILIGLLALSGVVMAVIVFLGLTESKAFTIAGLIFLADVYLIISLAARHIWLQRTIWVGTAITFILGVVVAFWEETEYYVGEWDPDVPYDEMQRSVYGFLSDLTFAAHTILGCLLALGIISIAHRWIRRERILMSIYYFMFVAGIVAGILWAIGYMMQFSDDLVPLQLGVSILALTAAAIIIIAGFVQRKAQQSEEQSRQLAAATQISGGLSDDALRARVRELVDEYLEERGR
ncbi:hypothetical protein [Leucobacter denitrificans]|uniref:Uncharacterized protein n=1 Tax=Leucobacter denitrificans TaxID=683042 RepID=A0A7G9S4F7_9MICO|nr:hypothetical protein [Leucobacter denitrificans]QNN62732.1 hypothetical protein H9L06_11020 [Leucobacter denitrificans]